MKQLLFGGVFLLLFVACSKNDIAEPTAYNSADNIKTMEDELLGIVNAHRESMGYTPLKYSAVAYQYAGKHNDYMIAEGTLSHDNFSSRASDISSVTDAEKVAENVAKDHKDAAAAFQGWLQSTDHRKTMEGNFTHTAVSVKKDSEGTIFYTQLFYR